MFVIHLKLFEASFLVLGHTILFGLPLFLFDDSPTDTWGNRTNVCDFHICIVCFCFCVLHWRIALPLYWGPIHQAGPPLPRACNFPHSVSGRGRGGGRAVGALVPFYLYLGFYFFIYTYLRVHFYLHLYLYFSLYVCLYTCAGHLYNSKSPPASWQIQPLTDKTDNCEVGSVWLAVALFINNFTFFKQK